MAVVYVRLPIQVVNPIGADMKVYVKSRWTLGAAVMGLAVNMGLAEPPPDIESALVKSLAKARLRMPTNSELAEVSE